MAEFDSIYGGLNQWSARLYFLDLVETLMPEVIAELGKKPFEAFSAIHSNPTGWETFLNKKSKIKDLLISPPGKLRTELLTDRGKLQPNLWAKFLFFRKLLYDWAIKYNLADEWLIKLFFELLCDWINHPKDERKDLSTVFEDSSDSIGDNSQLSNGTSIKFEFQFREWRPDVENKSDYRKALQNSFKVSENEYFKKMEKFALESGKKRNPRKNKLKTHLEWFIYYQIGGKTYREITELYIGEKGIDVQAVHKAVYEIAEVLGVKLRKGKRGRKLNF